MAARAADAAACYARQCILCCVDHGRPGAGYRQRRNTLPVTRPPQCDHRVKLTKMSKPISVLLAASALIVACWSAPAATPVHKCTVSGRVTYQRDPCPSSQTRQVPTIEHLNSEQRKRRAAPAPETAWPATAGGSARDAQSVDRMPAASPAAAAHTGARADRQAASAQALRCDGRRYCSQMTSCAEARFFLANCPDAAMDGNRDGIPCERQWCRR